jgi:hypothetical protein
LRLGERKRLGKGKVRGFTPIGIMECWNSGIMGFKEKKYQSAYNCI